MILDIILKHKYYNQLFLNLQKLDKNLKLEITKQYCSYTSNLFNLRLFNLRIELTDKEIEICDIEVYIKRQKIGSQIIDILKKFGKKYDFIKIIATEIKNTNEAIEFWKNQNFKIHLTSASFQLKKN